MDMDDAGGLPDERDADSMRINISRAMGLPRDLAVDHSILPINQRQSSQ
jgi:hypothetical protein